MQDLATFRRFLSLLAARHGHVLNKSDLAAPLGMSVPGVGRWLDILEATAQILIVPPWFENLGKRLIKSPRVYIADSGLDRGSRRASAPLAGFRCRSASLTAAREEGFTR